MRTLLQCGHVITDQSCTFGEFYPCPHCRTNVRTAAFECREWKVTCGIHRYGRWYGQDKTTAMRDKHSGHSMATVHYIAPQAVKDKVRKLYGRSVKILIDDIPAVNPWPDLRTTPAELEKTRYIPARNQDDADMYACPDIPPY
jgi:hypothetical protein